MRKAELEKLTYDNLEEDRLYPIGALRKILKDKGLPSSMFAIMSWEKKGLVTIPRANHNNWRMLTGREIKDLINKLTGRE